jgi:hypothetical protein
MLPNLLHPDFEQLVQEVEKARARYVQDIASWPYLPPSEEVRRFYLPPYEELYPDQTEMEREAIAARLQDYRPSGGYDERIMDWERQDFKLNELRAKASLAQRSSLLLRFLIQGRVLNIDSERNGEQSDRYMQ